LLFHSSELLISTGLGILSAGLSLAAVGAMNIVLLSSPRESSGVTIGMSSMLRIVGSSIGPALAAMYMQTNQSVINVKGVVESLPSSFSFDLIFLTAVALSIVSIILSILLSKKLKASTATLF
jgi:MFS family permease